MYDYVGKKIVEKFPPPCFKRRVSPGAVENRVEAEGDFYSNRHSLNSVSGVRVMSKIQSHSTGSHSDDCHCQCQS